MKFVIVLFALAAVCLAKPADVETVKSTYEQGENSYNYAYELSDGQRHNEEGEVKNIGEESAIVVKGSFSFVGDDGKTYVINYIADENGFQPSGDHIPVSP